MNTVNTSSHAVRSLPYLTSPYKKSSREYQVNIVTRTHFVKFAVHISAHVFYNQARSPLELWRCWILQLNIS